MAQAGRHRWWETGNHKLPMQPFPQLRPPNKHPTGRRLHHRLHLRLEYRRRQRHLRRLLALAAPRWPVVGQLLTLRQTKPHQHQEGISSQAVAEEVGEVLESAGQRLGVDGEGRLCRLRPYHRGVVATRLGGEMRPSRPVPYHQGVVATRLGD